MLNYGTKKHSDGAGRERGYAGTVIGPNTLMVPE